MMRIRPEELDAAERFDRKYLTIPRLTDWQIQTFDEKNKYWMEWRSRNPRLNNFIGLASLLVLLAGDLSLLWYWKFQGWAALGLLAFFHGFLMYALTVYSMHEGAGHKGIVYIPDRAWEPEKKLWRFLQKLAHNACRLVFADPKYYQSAHPAHHAYANTPDDGAYARFVKPARFWASLLPTAGFLPWNDYKIHSGDKWNKSHALSTVVGLAYWGICFYFLQRHYSIPVSIVLNLIAAPWVGFTLDRLRETSEHQLMPVDPDHNAKNVGLGPLAFFISGGPMGQAYHWVHHLYPFLPWYAQVSMGRSFSKRLSRQQKEFFTFPYSTGGVLGSLARVLISHTYWFNEAADWNIKRIFDMDEARELVELREKIYRESQKTPPPPEELEGALDDPHFELLGIYYKDKLVGGMNLWMGDKRRWVGVEPGGGVPRPEETVETAKLFLRTRYRTARAIKLLFRKVHETSRRTDRPYLLVASEARFLSIYQSIGFTPTGHHLNKQQLHGNSRLEVLVLRQRHAGIWAIFYHPLRWYTLGLPVWLEMWEQGKLRGGWYANLMLWIYFPMTLRGLLARWSYRIARRQRQEGL